MEELNESNSEKTDIEQIRSKVRNLRDKLRARALAGSADIRPRETQYSTGIGERVSEKSENYSDLLRSEGQNENVYDSRGGKCFLDLKESTISVAPDAVNCPEKHDEKNHDYGGTGGNREAFEDPCSHRRGKGSSNTARNNEEEECLHPVNNERDSASDCYVIFQRSGTGEEFLSDNTDHIDDKAYPVGKISGRIRSPGKFPNDTSYSSELNRFSPGEEQNSGETGSSHVKSDKDTDRVSRSIDGEAINRHRRNEIDRGKTYRRGDDYDRGRNDTRHYSKCSNDGERRRHRDISKRRSYDFHRSFDTNSHKRHNSRSFRARSRSGSQDMCDSKRSPAEWDGNNKALELKNGCNVEGTAEVDACSDITANSEEGVQSSQRDCKPDDTNKTDGSLLIFASNISEPTEGKGKSGSVHSPGRVGNEASASVVLPKIIGGTEAEELLEVEDGEIVAVVSDAEEKDKGEKACSMKGDDDMTDEDTNSVEDGIRSERSERDDLLTPDPVSGELLLTPDGMVVDASESLPVVDMDGRDNHNLMSTQSDDAVYGPQLRSVGGTGALFSEILGETEATEAGANANSDALGEGDIGPEHDDEKEICGDDDSMNDQGGCKMRSSLILGCRSVDCYRRLNKISEGTYGAVFRAIHKQTQEIVALKQVKYHAKLWSEGFPMTSLREISIMLELNHPNVLNVQQVVVGSGHHHVFMVMEYIEHELKTIMEEKPEFTVAERKCILKQLLEAVAYMHENFVFHRDIKPSNLLYSNKGILKVADFGMARKFGIPFEHKKYTQQVVTLWYRPPEILLGKETYDDKCDVWAVGAIFGELLKRKPLFAGSGELDTLTKIFALVGTPTDETWSGYNSLPFVRSKFAAKVPFMQPSWRDVFPHASKHLAMGNNGILSELGLDLMQKLLACDPEKRISARDALKHDYFTEKPRAQAPELMPSFPDTNNKARKKRRRGESAELDQKQHDHFRFGARVDAEKFLSALDEKTKGQRETNIKR